MGDRANNSEFYSEIVPDSTTRDNVLRKLIPTRSMDSIEEQPSSPSKPYSMPSSSMVSTSSRPAAETARPASRWAKSVTYGRKKDPLPEENDTEPESDAMDVTDTPFPSTSRATFTTPAPKARGKAAVASPARKSRSPSPKMGDGSDSDDDDNVDLGNSSSASKFGLTNWRDELNEIDKLYDEEEEEGMMRPQSRTERSRPLPDEDVGMDTEQDSPLAVNPTRVGDLHLTSSLSTLPSEDTAQSLSPSANTRYRSRKAVTTLESSSEPDDDEDPLGLPSAPDPRSHRPVKKRAVVDSDEEGDEPRRPTKLSRRSLAADTSRSSVSPLQAERMFDSPLNKNDGSPPSSPPEDPDATAAAPDVSSGSLNKAKKGKRVSSAGKPKKLSKKEQHNMWMETEILKAQAPVHVPEEEKEQPRMSMTDLFQRISGKAVPVGPTTHFNRRRTEISSDPIVDSSQPAPASTAVVFSGATFCPETPVFDSQASGKKGRVLVPNSSHDSIDGSARKNRISTSEDENDNDRLPDLEEQIRKENELRKKEQALKELREKKLLWAAQQRKAAEERKKKAAAMFEDEDDEEELEIEGTMVDSQAESLEIVESQHGRFNTGEHLRKAVVKDRVHAAISPFKPSSASKAPKEFRHPRKSMPTTDSFIEYVGKTDLLGVKSKPPPPKSRASVPMIKKLSTFGPLDLKGQLLKDVRLMDAKIRRERDEEWEGKGGHAGRKQQIEQVAKLKQLGGEKLLGEWAKKGLEVAEDEMARAEAEYEDEEEGDEEDEDYKPEEQEADAEMTGDEPQEENDAAKVERSRSSSMEPPTEDEDKENRVIEDKENVPPPRKARAALADKDDLFSPHQPSEAEDEPEDKENAPPPRDQPEDDDEVDDEDLFGLRPLKKHTARRIVADEEDEDEDVTAPSKDENVPPRRSPLKFDAFDDDDEPPRPAGLPFGGAGGKMLMFNSSAESLDDGGAEKEQTAVDKGDGFDMTDAEIEGDGFTQLFGLDSKPAGFDALRRREPLDDMDLESQKLLPRMDLSTQELQKDDAIFEQDQIVRAAIEREERQKALQAQTKKYLNEDGFFTQTKPSSQLHIDFPGDSQALFAVPPVIDDGVLATQEQDAPLRRLRRGHARQDSSDSLPPSTDLAPAKTEKKRDAFSVLMTVKPKEPKKKDKEKEKQMREFLQDQADESDEDKIIGFGDVREDENDDDEENDKHLEGLVDDKQMEQAEINEQAVVEKHQEQLAQDDAALEKYHLAAAKGEYRGKKRDRGIGLSDDESDPDDDANRRRRLAMRKKRVVIGGDQLEDLANNERTSAFYKTYEQGIVMDEDNDFGYIPSSEQPEPEEDVVEEDEDEEGADNEEEKDDEPAQPRVVNARQLRRELLAAAERGETSIDPDDITWVDRSLQSDDDDMNGDFGVKEVNRDRKAAFRTFGQVEVDEESRRENFRLAKLGDPKARAQVRREDKGATYGVAKAGSAITSHSSKSKASSSLASSKAGSASRPLAKSVSLLQRVPTKKDGFNS